MSEVISAKDVVQALTFTCKMTGFDLDDDERKYFLSKLKGRMSGKEIVVALDDLVEKNRKPTLAAILAYEKGGFDDADTAYAKAIASITDESITCLMNDAIMQAWSFAQPLYQEGMNYDASRAFKTAYESAVMDMKSAGLSKPKWFLSMGTDKTQREDFIRQATADGLITLDYAKVQLPHLTDEELENPLALPQKPTIMRLTENLESQSAEMSEEDMQKGRACIQDLQKLLGGVA